MFICICVCVCVKIQTSPPPLLPQVEGLRLKSKHVYISS